MYDCADNGKVRRFNRWDDLQSYLDGRGLFRMEPGLERMARCLRTLALARPSFRVAQIVGTNGKGSTSTFLASLAAAHGLTCGLSTSPHFVSVRERARLFSRNAPPGGSLFSEGEWLDAANWLDAADPPAFGDSDEALTYFELIIVLSLILFRSAGVDLAVMESGLGGRFDAVTAIRADLLVYTPIAMDHAEILGGTLRAIAADKAGAMRGGAVVFAARQNRDNPEVREELELAARRSGSGLFFCSGKEPLPEELRGRTAPLALRGPHQMENAALALTAWKHLGQKIGSAANSVAWALAGAWLPGRLQRVPMNAMAIPPHPEMILDGAHNPHGLSALGRALAQAGVAPPVTIFSCLRGKQPEKMAAHLRVLATGQILVPRIQGHPNAMPAGELAGMIGLAARPVENVGEALRLAWRLLSERLPETLVRSGGESGPPLLVCGSLYLLGELFAIYPQYLEAGRKQLLGRHQPGGKSN